MTRFPYKSNAHKLDPRVVSVLTCAQRVVLGAIAVIAGVALVAWVVPQLRPLLPAPWMLMDPATLGCALLCALSLTLSQSGRSPRCLSIGRIFAVMVTVVAASCLLEVLYGSRLLAAPSAARTLIPSTVAMAPAVAFAYLLLGIVVCYLRQARGLRAVAADLTTVAASMLMLILTSGYLFDSGRALDGGLPRRVAPEELLMLLLLTFAVFTRRAESGAFSILLEPGIGGATARIAAPVAIGLPLLMGLIEIGGVSSGLLAPAYIAAVVASVMSVVAFCLVLVLARHAGALEQEIDELSLRDPLTGLYSRRSFLLLAEQTLRQSRRSSEPFSVLLLSVDDLSGVDRAPGEPTVADQLQRMALLLSQNFREADVTARLSGDNFVVAARANSAEMAVATYRLLQNASLANERLPERAALNFSYGHVTSDHSTPFTLEALLDRANAILSEDKRSKRGTQGLRGVPELVRSLDPLLNDRP